MSWEMHEAEQYAHDIKALKKCYKRETEQMLDNLEAYKQFLAVHDTPPLLMVEFSFVHRESAGCHAIMQHPPVLHRRGSTCTATRMGGNCT